MAGASGFMAKSWTYGLQVVRVGFSASLMLMFWAARP